MTTITFKSYVRRDGSMMLYVNRSNGVSVGLSPERGWAPYGKNSTEGQRNAMSAALKVFMSEGRVFTGDLSKHNEGGFCAAISCDPITLVGTDVANIGGMDVGADGAYVIYGDRILKCGVAYPEE